MMMMMMMTCANVIGIKLLLTYLHRSVLRMCIGNVDFRGDSSNAVNNLL